MDEKFKLKYDIPLKDIAKISMTSQSDDLLVLHVQHDKENKSKAKGDHLLYIDSYVFYAPITAHAHSLIEFVTQLDATFKKQQGGRRIPVEITDTIEVHFKGRSAYTLEVTESPSEEDQVGSILFL